MSDLSIASDSGMTATARVMENLQLFGYRPQPGEVDPRTLPDTESLDTMIATLFETIVEPLSDTSLEADLQDLLWSLTNLFHLKAERVTSSLERNEDQQRAAQKIQDGSEIQSVELERLIETGQALLDKRDIYEQLTTRAADQFEAVTGSAWRPRTGSMVDRKNLTAAVIDSRDFLSAKRRADTEIMIPKGTKIAFAGGTDYKDHRHIWDVLDKVHAKHPDMVLLHTANTHGADAIAASWAMSRKVVQIPFKLNRKGATDRAAPYRRNELLIGCMPQGLIAFPGSGIVDNLCDQAKRVGIQIADYRKPATT